MNWGKAVIAGAVGGVVVSIYSYVMHGIVLGSYYVDHPAFTQQQSSPVWFVVVAVFVGMAGGVLFAKTRSSWQAGVKGGATFGFYVGLITMFAQLYFPLILTDFAYMMGWTWGFVNFVGWIIFGAVAGAMYKPVTAAA